MHAGCVDVFYYLRIFWHVSYRTSITTNVYYHECWTFDAPIIGEVCMCARCFPRHFPNRHVRVSTPPPPPFHRAFLGQGLGVDLHVSLSD